MQGIIFDFNGTLFWDSQLHYDAWREYSAILRGKAFSDEEMREKMFGHTNEDIIEYALGRKPSKELIAKYANEKEELYRNCCLSDPENFKLAPGVTEFLDFIKANNIPRTIATMSDWDNVDFYIKHLNLKKWFDIENIVYSNGKIPGKPAPDIFIIAAKKINLSINDCLVFEDAIAGIESAKAANAGRIIAVASLEPTDFYNQMTGISQIITHFNQIDKMALLQEFDC